MAAPVVDGLEQEIGDRLDVVRLNVQNTDGMLMRDRDKVSTVPTFVMLDGEGEELWRSAGALDTEEVHAALDSP